MNQLLLFIRKKIKRALVLEYPFLKPSIIFVLCVSQEQIMIRNVWM